MTDEICIDTLLDTTPRHTVLEEVVHTLCTMTQNDQPEFFRPVVAYFFAKMAGSMGATVRSEFEDRGMPINIYTVALASSGFGKGYSVSIMQDMFLKKFKERFMEETFEEVAERHLWELACERAVMSGKEEEEEKKIIDKQFERAGPVPFTFSSATPQAIKDVREKLMLAKLGSINFQVDEIGSNLISQTDALNLFLELYDYGHTEMRLVKNTADNQRFKELTGRTAANMLLFGTSSKLMDGSDTQRSFLEFLETGYARRCLFGWGIPGEQKARITPKERLKRLKERRTSSVDQQIQDHFGELADSARYGWEVVLDEDSTLALMEYEDQCKKRADEMSDYEVIRKPEMQHRHSKVLKLAGALAFVDGSTKATLTHIAQSIQIVEDSGRAFEKVITPVDPWIRLAKDLAALEGPVTEARLMDLPYYKSAKSTDRRNWMALAASWGYTNNVIIRKTYEDSIEFWEGESLQETQLDKLMLSYSNHEAYNYGADQAPFDEMHKLLAAPGMHWCNHSFKGGHRKSDNAIEGFNMVVIDVDGGVPLHLAHQELAEYAFITSTTKRHTADEHRYRLILPLSHRLNLDEDDYAEFMDNVMQWLPFASDPGARQRSKKWLTNPNTQIHVNQGNLLSALPFIPKTTKNEEFHREMEPLKSMDNLERWFAQRFTSGSRNNHMIRFALALLDTGMSYSDIERAVLSFNNRLSNGLTEDELRNTVLLTVAKKAYTPAA